MFRVTIIWEKTILIIWENPTEARGSVLARPQFLPTGAPRVESSGVSRVGQTLLQAAGGWASPCIARCRSAAWDASGLNLQSASTSRGRPLYHDEGSWNSLKSMICFGSLDTGRSMSMTYTTSRSCMSSCVPRECEMNPPPTSVISVQRNRISFSVSAFQLFLEPREAKRGFLTRRSSKIWPKDSLRKAKRRHERLKKSSKNCQREKQN